MGLVCCNYPKLYCSPSSVVSLPRGRVVQALYPRGKLGLDGARFNCIGFFLFELKDGVLHTVSQDPEDSSVVEDEASVLLNALCWAAQLGWRSNLEGSITGSIINQCTKVRSVLSRKEKNTETSASN